jgi:hypothetical protein
LAPSLNGFFTAQQTFRLCLGVSFKHPLLLNFSKHIVVSEVHIVAFRAHVKIICGELNLPFRDLPVLKCFDCQKSSLVEVLNLPDASHFGISLKLGTGTGVVGKN